MLVAKSDEKHDTKIRKFSELRPRFWYVKTFFKAGARLKQTLDNEIKEMKKAHCCLFVVVISTLMTAFMD